VVPVPSTALSSTSAVGWIRGLSMFSASPRVR
jgi:hypothetical protein